MVHVLLEKGLGYKSGTYGEGKDVVERALRSAVSLFNCFHEHRDLLIRNQRKWFGSPILKVIGEAIFTKVNQSGKKAELNKEILDAKVKYVREHIRDCPISYQRRNDPDEPRAGEAILSKLEGVVYILVHHLSPLHNDDYHNKENLNRESGGNVDSNNCSFKIVPKG